VSSEHVEAEGAGETVGEARWAALRELERLAPGLDREAVEYVVVSEGQRGLMGLGREPAKVLARAARPPAVAVAPSASADPLPVNSEPDRPVTPPDNLSEDAARVHELVSRITDAIADDFEVRVDEGDEEIRVVVEGSATGLVIGHHGHTIDAIQHLVSAIVYPAPGPRRDIVVDAQGYRGRRERTLRDLAKRAADDAVRSGRAMELEPMSSAERKVVHLALAERGDVETSSEGREPVRYVVIRPLHD
jgi:spoIIIJ-associated protein